MGKNKKKRKNKKEVLNAGKYSIEEESFYKEEKNNDKEQRRTTRLGAIISIIAITGTICMLTFKMSVITLNVWADGGIAYRYLQLLMILSTATVAIWGFRLIEFVINDLQRYNMASTNYIKYDEKADKSYNLLIQDFKIYIGMLVCIIAISPLILNVNNNKMQEISTIIIMSCLGIVAIWSGINFVKKNKTKVWFYIKLLCEKFFIWMVSGSICLLFGLTFLINSEAKIKVNFQCNGKIEICMTSAEHYSGLKIEIYDDNDEVIFEKNVDRNEILRAREIKKVYKENAKEKMEEATVVNSELLHWKYIVDISDKLKKEGTYYVYIFIEQEGAEVEIMNTLFIDSEEYIYAKETMEKGI